MTAKQGSGGLSWEVEGKPVIAKLYIYIYIHIQSNPYTSHRATWANAFAGGNPRFMAEPFHGLRRKLQAGEAPLRATAWDWGLIGG